MRGKLYVLRNGEISLYLDLAKAIGDNFTARGKQQGFISFTFYPDFGRNGIIYTVHTEYKGEIIPDFPVTKPISNNKGEQVSSSHHDVLTRWTVDNPEQSIFQGEGKEILRIEQPYPDHNVGEIAFNPNAQPGSDDYGLLYISIADGGSDGFPVSNTDPLDNGQDLSTPLGKILRIDPAGSNGPNGKYGIPLGNPLQHRDSPEILGEIWAYGLRNPHRFSWDTEGDEKMLIADIGQAFIEEVNLGSPGANYGWGNREGTFVIDDQDELVLYPLPDDDNLYNYSYPVAQYDHDLTTNVAIAGGYVYRGSAIPELHGKYVFADFATDGRFFLADVDTLDEGSQAQLEELLIYDKNEETTFLDIIAKTRSDLRFGTDETGEIYIINKQDGIVRRLAPYRPSDSKTFYADYASEIFKGHGDQDKVVYKHLPVSLKLILSDSRLEKSTTSKPKRSWIDTLDSIEIIEGNPNLTHTVDATKLKPQEALIDLANNQVTFSDNTDSIKVITLLHFRNAIGTKGNDIIKGDSKSNRIEGGQGNDRIEGGFGADILIGDEGNDHYIVDNRQDRVIERFDQGVDTITSEVSFRLPVHTENLNLMGTSNLVGTGNASSNRMTGNSGSNILHGQLGADILTGGEGDDVINLGFKDRAADTIHYAAGDGHDQIVNFTKGSDRINIISKIDIDVVAHAKNTRLSIGNGIPGDSGFGKGKTIMTLRGVSGLTRDHLSNGGSSTGSENRASFFFA
jgi:glucose/arabinose dehydrogenase